MRAWASIVAVVAVLTLVEGVRTLAEGDLTTGVLFLALVRFEALYFVDLLDEIREGRR